MLSNNCTVVTVKSAPLKFKRKAMYIKTYVKLQQHLISEQRSKNKHLFFSLPTFFQLQQNKNQFTSSQLNAARVFSINTFCSVPSICAQTIKYQTLKYLSGIYRGSQRKAQTSKMTACVLTVQKYNKSMYRGTHWTVGRISAWVGSVFSVSLGCTSKSQIKSYLVKRSIRRQLLSGRLVRWASGFTNNKSDKRTRSAQVRTGDSSVPLHQPTVTSCSRPQALLVVFKKAQPHSAGNSRSFWLDP